MPEPAPPPTPPAPRPARGLSAFLTAQQFGMPRWVWLGLLAGGIGAGIYLRNRSAEAEAEAPEEDLEYDPYAEEGEPSIYDESLAGVGILPGGSTGEVVPVSAPYLPEGFADILGGIADIFAVIGENPDAFNPDPDGNNNGGTGGGPPRRPNRVLDPNAARKLRRPFERGELAHLRRLLRPGPDQDANVLTPWEWKQLTRGLDRRERAQLRRQVTIRRENALTPPPPTPTP